MGIWLGLMIAVVWLLPIFPLRRLWALKRAGQQVIDGKLFLRSDQSAEVPLLWDVSRLKAKNYDQRSRTGSYTLISKNRFNNDAILSTGTENLPLETTNIEEALWYSKVKRRYWSFDQETSHTILRRQANTFANVEDLTKLISDMSGPTIHRLGVLSVDAGTPATLIGNYMVLASKKKYVRDVQTSLMQLVLLAGCWTWALFKFKHYILKTLNYL
jgi:hypothetical protein